MVLSNSSVVPILLLLITFFQTPSFLDAIYRLTQIDEIANNYLREEKDYWDHSIPLNETVNESITLAEINGLFRGRIDLDVYKAEHLQTVNGVFAELIADINITQRETAHLLLNREYFLLKRLAIENVQTVVNRVNQIFEEANRTHFLNYAQANWDQCETPFRIEENNEIISVYKIIAASLVRGYMTGQTFYMVLAITKRDGSNYRNFASNFRETFTRNYRMFESQMKSIIQKPSDVIWMCDNYYFNDSNTYVEITNFLQGYIDNEVNLNSKGSCVQTCSDYEVTQNFGCKNDTFCNLNYLDKNKTRCDGLVRNCRFIESDMVVCPNEDDTMRNRRYNYVRYSSGQVLGTPQFCPDQVEVNSWLRFMVSCSYCMCYCDHESRFSDRYFSLHEVVSNVQENKIVTGIRFSKRNRIIHLAIHESILFPQGVAENYTGNNWKSDYNFNFGDPSVVPGRDYYNLTYENRAIELDKIRVPPGQVVTGVRLRVVNGRLRLEIRGTEFNLAGGELSHDPGRSRWYNASNKYKTKIVIENSDMPLKSPLPSMRNREDNKFVEFVPTDIYKDIAQTTVPFIETIPVQAKKPTPLSGLGLYYKSRPGYGGFIGILMIPLNITRNTYESIGSRNVRNFKNYYYN